VLQTSDVIPSIYHDERRGVGTARPPAVGAIIGMRAVIEAVFSLPHSEFDRLWAFALSGRLTHAYMAFTEPRYNKSRVLAVSFSGEREN
jgi:hypothetical protein